MIYVNSTSTREGAPPNKVYDYFVDTEADIANLPGNTEIATSSTALVIATGDLWTLSNVWKKVGG